MTLTTFSTWAGALAHVSNHWDRTVSWEHLDGMWLGVATVDGLDVGVDLPDGCNQPRHARGEDIFQDLVWLFFDPPPPICAYPNRAELLDA